MPIIVVPLDQSPVSAEVFAVACRAALDGGRALLIVVPPGREIIQATAEAEALVRGIEVHSIALESDRADELLAFIQQQGPEAAVAISPYAFDYAGWLSLITTALVRARPCPFLVARPRD